MRYIKHTTAVTVLRKEQDGSRDVKGNLITTRTATEVQGVGISYTSSSVSDEPYGQFLTTSMQLVFPSSFVVEVGDEFIFNNEEYYATSGVTKWAVPIGFRHLKTKQVIDVSRKEN